VRATVAAHAFAEDLVQTLEQQDASSLSEASAQPEAASTATERAAGDTADQGTASTTEKEARYSIVNFYHLADVHHPFQASQYATEPHSPNNKTGRHNAKLPAPFVTVHLTLLQYVHTFISEHP